MTSPHPGRRIEPLPPPPGAFDAVLNRARARRYRRLTAVTGVTAVFLAGIMGGLAMGGGVSGVQESLISVATGNGLGGDDVPTSDPLGEQRAARPVAKHPGREPHLPGLHREWQEHAGAPAAGPRPGGRRQRQPGGRPVRLHRHDVGQGVRAHLGDSRGDHQCPRGLLGAMHRRPGADHVLGAEPAARALRRRPVGCDAGEESRLRLCRSAEGHRGLARGHGDGQTSSPTRPARTTSSRCGCGSAATGRPPSD